MTVRVIATQGRPLTPRAKRFAVAYAREDVNGKEAAIIAGFSPNCAAHRASLLLKQSRVWAVIDAEREAMRRAEEAAATPKLDREAIRAEARATVERLLAPRRTERTLP
jgi:phage terminase small subunit